MHDLTKFGVIIPAYNAERTIGRLVQELIIYGFKKENVIVVDDGSQDKTAEAGEKQGVTVLRLAKNAGKGWALIQGFKEAQKRDLLKVVTMDADGQHETGELGKFVNSNNNNNKFDMIIGSRRSDFAPMPFLRKFTNRTTSLVISLLCNKYIPDVQSGYRMVSMKIFDKVNLRTKNFQTESELACKAVRAGFKIGFVPIYAVYGDEQSYIVPLTDTIRFISMAVRFLIWR